MQKNRVQLREEVREFYKDNNMKISEGAVDVTIDIAQEITDFLAVLPEDVAEKIQQDMERNIERLSKIADSGRKLTPEEIKRVMQGEEI